MGAPFPNGGIITGRVLSGAVAMDGSTEPAVGWRHFPHGADVGVSGYGPSLAQAFEQAAVALIAVITEPGRCGRSRLFPSPVTRLIPKPCWWTGSMPWSTRSPPASCCLAASRCDRGFASGRHGLWRTARPGTPSPRRGGQVRHLIPRCGWSGKAAAGSRPASWTFEGIRHGSGGARTSG